MVYKNNSPRASGNVSKGQSNKFRPYYSIPEALELAPLLPPADAPPIPEEYWLIHRYRKGGVR